MNGDRAVTPVFALAEAEALALFLAEREELWRQHAHDCGVEDPSAAPQQLAQAYANAIRRVSLAPRKAA
jgi:hypothetical protein